MCLTITSGNNCSSTWCDSVHVVSFNFCNNYFTYQTSGTGQQTTHTFPGPGTYYVSLISTDTTGCTAISDQIIVVSGGTFNQIYGQVYTGNFPVLQGYVLLFSDNVNPSQNSYFSITPIDSMGVYVFSQVPNGNQLILGVEENEPLFAVEGIFPNPASDKVTLSIYSAENQIGTIKILDLNGKVVQLQSTTLQMGNNVLEMNVHAWTKGIYFVQIMTENGQQSTLKLIKN